MTTAWVPLATTTLSSSASSVTFGSISGSYRDLVLVIQGGSNFSGDISFEVYPNGDTANGSMVSMQGDGSSASSFSTSRIFFTMNNANGMNILQFMDYSATDKHKTILIRDTTTATTRATAGRWASTSAITSIELEDATGQTFDAGTTFSLYGSNRL